MSDEKKSDAPTQAAGFDPLSSLKETVRKEAEAGARKATKTPILIAIGLALYALSEAKKARRRRRHD